MEEFRMIATVLSMVLGLGVTRLLLGVVTVFRIRRTAAVDWIPLVWAAVLFLSQLQFWWAINFLGLVRHSFAFADFIFLVLLTLMLFLAAALLLPSRAEDESLGLRDYFEEDGRYGLLAFVAFLVLGLFANIVLFGAAPLAGWALLDVPMIALPIAVFFTTSRRVRAWITIAYAPLAIIDLWVSLG